MVTPAVPAWSLNNRATPDGFLNVLNYGARGNDPGDGTGQDDSAAFQACGAAALAQHKGMWVPDTGNAYKINTTVTISSANGNVLRIAGGGYILCNTGLAANVFEISNIEWVSIDLNFRGLIDNPAAPQRVRFADCLHAVQFFSCRLAFVTGRYFWLGAQEFVIYNAGETGLHCSGVLMEGAAGILACIGAVNWRGLTIEHSQFIDIGLYNGFPGGNAIGSLPTQTIPGAWVRLYDPADVARGETQQVPTFVDVLGDESVLRQVQVTPAATRIQSMRIDNWRGSTYRTNTTPPAFDISKVDMFYLQRSCAMRLSPGGGVADSDAVSLTGVTRASIDGCRFGSVAGDSNTIRVDGTSGVIDVVNMVQGTDYLTLTTAAPVLAVPAVPTLTGIADGISPWTITPGTGGGLVDEYALCANGVLTGLRVLADLNSATASVTFAQPAGGPVYTVIAIGPSGQSVRSAPLAFPANALNLSLNGTFARNLVAWYFTQAPNDGSGGGFLAQALANVRRLDTRGDVVTSLLMEKAATNYVLQSRSPQTTPPWTAGTGTTNGNNNLGVDGTMVAANISVAATAVGNYALSPGPAGRVCISQWARGRLAVQSNQMTLVSNAAVALVPHVQVLNATPFVHVDATGNAVASSGIDPVDGGDRTGTGGQAATAQDMVIDGAQLETGYYPTSMIVTAAVTVTRPADTLSYATGNYPVSFLTAGVKILFAADASSAEIDSSAETWRFAQNGANDYIEMIGAGAGAVTIRIVCGGVVKGSLTGITFSRAQVLTITGKPTAGTIIVSGATAGNGTNTVAGAAWAAAQTLYIGGNSGGANNVTGRYVGYAVQTAP